MSLARRGVWSAEPMIIVIVVVVGVAITAAHGGSPRRPPGLRGFDNKRRAVQESSKCCSLLDEYGDRPVGQRDPGAGTWAPEQQ